MLDYDGTLLPYERPSVARAKGKTTNEEMLKIIKQLAADPRNVIYIMSGRTRQSLENIFGSIDSIGLCAEGGCFLKHTGKSTWEDQFQEGADMQWRKKVMEVSTKLYLFVNLSIGYTLVQRTEYVELG